MAAIVVVPITGEDTLVYSFACDASGGSAAGTPGGGLVQLDGSMARYKTVLALADGAGPTTWLPDATHPAVRAVALLNGSNTPLSVTIKLYDSAANAQTGIFWAGILAAGEILPLSVPLTAGLTWELSAALGATEFLTILAN